MRNGSILIHDIAYLVTMGEQREILQDAWLWIEDGFVRALGEGVPPDDVPKSINRLSGADRIVIPGLVNTHHHCYQNMARAYSPGNDLPLLPWLERMNALWADFREQDLQLCTEFALAELMLSGATTVADHHYVFPRGARAMVDRQFEAAAAMGVRFHASRGSMDVGSQLIADWAIESQASILADTERVIESYHDASKGSWQQVIVAPCAATSCSEGLLRESAALAKQYGTGLHTHCGETEQENAFSIKHYGRRPLSYLLDCGWDYAGAWLAHGIHFSDDELDRLKAHGIGVAHCPNANMRLGSGICRVPEMLDRGIKVGIGVDGSASNDSGHILGELRQALYLARVRYGAEALSALDALELGTWRAAMLLGRDDLGRLAPGYCGDCAVFAVDHLYSNGAENPVDGLLLCHPREVTDLVTGGVVRVRHGQLVDTDLSALARRHAGRARQLNQSGAAAGG
jgi:8-oxoguanine deaminase